MNEPPVYIEDGFCDPIRPSVILGMRGVPPALNGLLDRSETAVSADASATFIHGNAGFLAAKRAALEELGAPRRTLEFVL
jgi:hypothetical protein